MCRNRWLVFVLIAFCVLSGIASAQPPNAKNFVAHLSGDEEVPPVDTSAQGQATFQFYDESGELDFLLIVANIENVVAAHIHCAPIGVNGPVGVTLFSGGPVTVNGILVEGTITAPDAGNTCGWSNIDAVVEAMRDGDTYVNVHTNAHPGGEIRGQILEAGPWGR